MSEIEIIKEEPITLIGINLLLEKIKKRDKEINERAVKTQEYVNKVTKKADKDVKEKLEKAGIARLKSKHITKIIDLQPKDIDSIKALFTSEPITLKQEEFNKILECLK